MNSYAIWGRYSDRDHARLARNRFEDQPGAHHRVRYMPDERYPAEPYCLCVYDYEDEANEVDANGEVLPHYAL